MKGGTIKGRFGMRNLISLWIWFAVQLVILAAVVIIAWFVMMPADAGIDTRMLALEAKIGANDLSRAMKHLYVWREGLSWLWPFLIVAVVLGSVLWSVGITIREIGEAQERIGMRR